jgi:c(7)-type cytochrome triheme protein
MAMDLGQDRMRRLDRRGAGAAGIAAFAGVFVVMAAAALLAFGLPARVRIPRAADHRPFAPAAQAQFSHPAHESLRCFQCHPGLFPQAPLAFTHAAMEGGRFCGACHDGQRATAIAKLPCESCHAP